jgi:hypothetical protein
VNRSTDPASSVAGTESGSTSSPAARHGAALLAAATRGLERHRAAVLAQDAAATARALDALAPVLTELMELAGPSNGSEPSFSPPSGRMDPAEAAELARQAAQVREELLLNQALVANGIAITDHYAVCVVEASAEGGPTLLSEVA